MSVKQPYIYVEQISREQLERLAEEVVSQMRVLYMLIDENKSEAAPFHTASIEVWSKELATLNRIVAGVGIKLDERSK